MLEIRRDTYMDEQSVTIDLEKFSVLQQSLQQLVNSLSKPTAR
jgi:hypothetical protein